MMFCIEYRYINKICYTRGHFVRTSRDKRMLTLDVRLGQVITRVCHFPSHPMYISYSTKIAGISTRTRRNV